MTPTSVPGGVGAWGIRSLVALMSPGFGAWGRVCSVISGGRTAHSAQSASQGAGSGAAKLGRVQIGREPIGRKQLPILLFAPFSSFEHIQLTL